MYISTHNQVLYRVTINNSNAIFKKIENTSRFYIILERNKKRKVKENKSKIKRTPNEVVLPEGRKVGFPS